MGNEYNAVRPHAPQDTTRIAAGSPLAVLGIFLEALRERFSDQANLGIVWREDVQLTDIIIETGYNVEVEARNSGRGLYVTRLNSTPTQVIVADRVGVHLPDHMEGFMCMMDSQITIDCVSNDMGESALLADIVQGFLLASRQIMAAMYGFHDVSHAEMGQTLPFEHSQEQWSTTVSVRVQYHTRWTTVKIRPLLQSLGLRMTDSPNSSTFEQIAAASMQRRFPLDPPGADDGTTPAPAPAPYPANLAISANTIFLPHQPLAGVLDGVNRVFQASVPFISGDSVREVVYRNGVQVSNLLYTVDVPLRTITFLTAPLPTDTLLLDAYVETAQ